MADALTNDEARSEIIELRRIMVGTLDFDRLQRVIECAAHLMFRVPQEWVVSCRAVIVEAERRSRYATLESDRA